MKKQLLYALIAVGIAMPASVHPHTFVNKTNKKLGVALTLKGSPVAVPVGFMPAVNEVDLKGQPKNRVDWNGFGCVDTIHIGKFGANNQPQVMAVPIFVATAPEQEERMVALASSRSFAQYVAQNKISKLIPPYESVCLDLITYRYTATRSRADDQPTSSISNTMDASYGETSTFDIIELADGSFAAISVAYDKNKPAKSATSAVVSDEKEVD